MTKVYYFDLNDNQEVSYTGRYLDFLHCCVIECKRQFLNEERLKRFLVGRMMVYGAFKDFGINLGWHKITIDTYGRPQYDGDADFNISHSGNLIVCALSTDASVGIDIEYSLAKRNTDRLYPFFAESDWKHINRAALGDVKFYEYWTKKESVLKADGRGMSYPLNRVEVCNENVLLEGKIFYCRSLAVHKDYQSHLASAIPLRSLTLEKITIDTLNNLLL